MLRRGTDARDLRCLRCSVGTNPAKALAAREVLAKRIIDMAQGGVLDVAELRDDALAHLRRAELGALGPARSV
jgi:hypothetical protein